MADSDSDILNTTKKGMKKNIANQKYGTEITLKRPQLKCLMKTNNFFIRAVQFENPESQTFPDKVLMRSVPRYYQRPKIRRLARSM